MDFVDVIFMYVYIIINCPDEHRLINMRCDIIQISLSQGCIYIYITQSISKTLQNDKLAWEVY